MMRIELTQNIYALIDDEDYSLVGQHNWYAARANRCWYAVTALHNPETKKQCTLQMHRLIMNAQLGQEIDHREHFRLL